MIEIEEEEIDASLPEFGTQKQKKSNKMELEMPITLKLDKTVSLKTKSMQKGSKKYSKDLKNCCEFLELEFFW
jgi:invasion protein IalB